ncbi:NUDIX hydrolase [Gordonia tangerina]|uniref:NUDIX hydrolase n=1 Tax=Gordonia tangerina TaxID=2911060 RepID=A0ABS9DCJ3_9ACTN|nr:NUDIX hydrolase [Gordonia tangerina]MCF3936827.1 NUDIX hydrolase [Gordonia tangerina]
MSADPSTDPSDVSDDVMAGSRGPNGTGRRDSGHQDSARSADTSTGHRVTPADLARANSRGGGVQTGTGSTATDDSGGTTRRGRRGRRRRGRRPSPPSTADAGHDETPAAERRDTPNPGQMPKRSGKADHVEEELRPTHTRVSPPKPSDLVAVTAKITKTGLTHTSAGAEATTSTTAKSKTRRRTGGKGPERGQERLRTVRETSAGGLVISDLDLPTEELCAALIGRMDRRGRMMWSLPKGHIETGETAEQTAIREVAEETGISGTVVAPLGKIDYWFVSEGRRIHKTVHHYLLRSIGGELSDADYEVSEVAWVPLEELPRKLTYSDERRLARMARGVIADLAADPNRLAQSEAESIRTEPNAYERAAAARNQRRNEPLPPARSRRRRRRPRRPPAGDA